MKNVKKVVAPIILCLSVAVVISGCTAVSANTAPQAEKQKTAVETTIVKPDTIIKEMIYAGQVTPEESVSVISKITGKVEEFYFDVGDTVNQGDVLFTLDKKDIQNQIDTLNAQINQSSTGVRTAQNAISNVTGGRYQSEIMQQETTLENLEKQLSAADIAISNAEITLDNAKKTLENTQISFDNAKALFEIEALSKTDFDKAELGLSQAQAALNQAQNMYNQAVFSKEQLETNKKAAEEGYDLTKGQVTQDNLRSAQLALDSAVAARNLLNVQFEILNETLMDTAITAPITGLISSRNAKTSEYVSSQLPAYSIINIDRVYIDVKVSELLINSIRTGQEVNVYISSVSEEAFTGKIHTISPSADQTGTFPVKIVLDNKEHTIKPGMFAEVRFIKEISKNTVVLPRNTVLEDMNISFVYINNGGSAKKTMVTLGIDNGQFIEIVDGVSFGDQVITKGHTYVVDSEEINVVTTWGE